MLPIAARAADATGIDTKALTHKTRRLVDDAGQFYMAWWLPQALSQAILQDTPKVPETDNEQMLRALEPYVVFALSRGEVGANGLENVRDRADLLRNSRLTVDGQTMSAAPADQNDPGAQAALEMIKPVLAATLGRNARGIEFALYRPGALACAHSIPPCLVASNTPSIASTFNGNCRCGLLHRCRCAPRQRPCP